jgi:hypothetical protein
VDSSDRALRTLRVLLIVAIVVSVFHYVDNFVRFDQYPQDEPELVTRPMIPIAWVVLTAFGVAGYVLCRRGRVGQAAACLAVYSVSGLIGPLHYTSGALDEFDAFQHVNIAADGLAGLAVLLFAVWLYRSAPSWR